MRKVAVVTGCSQGLGYDICDRLIDEGYFVYGLSRSQPPMDLYSYPDTFEWIECDISNARKVETAFDKRYENLLELNLDLIKTILNFLKINVNIVFSSSLDISTTGSDRILDICKALNSNVYLSGIGGKEYLNLNDFAKNNITIETCNLLEQHSEYIIKNSPQMFYLNRVKEYKNKLTKVKKADSKEATA